jgi:hypothetical protein
MGKSRKIHFVVNELTDRTCVSADKILAAGPDIFQGTGENELIKHWRPEEMRLLSHTYREIPVGNAVNEFSQRQCWRLVLLDQFDLSRLTQRILE